MTKITWEETMQATAQLAGKIKIVFPWEDADEFDEYSKHFQHR